MTNLECFGAYAADFEQTYKDDDWSRLDRYFAPDATYQVKGDPFTTNLRAARRSSRASRSRSTASTAASHARHRARRRARGRGRHRVAAVGVTYNRDGNPPLVLRGRSSAKFAGERIVELTDSYEKPALERWARGCGSTAATSIRRTPDGRGSTARALGGKSAHARALRRRREHRLPDRRRRRARLRAARRLAGARAAGAADARAAIEGRPGRRRVALRRRRAHPADRLMAAAGTSYLGFRPSGLTYETIRKGHWEPRARLADMDADGIHAQLLYPSVSEEGARMFGDDRALQLACVRAYNEWQLEFCAVAPDRLFGHAVIPRRASPTPSPSSSGRSRRATAACSCRRSRAAASSRRATDDPFWARVQERTFPSRSTSAASTPTVR
jgi:hypothetical protein